MLVANIRNISELAMKKTEKNRNVDNLDAINQRINEIALNFFSGNNSEFGRALGTSPDNITNYRKKNLPNAAFIRDLNDKLNINPEWLVLGTGSMNYEPVHEGVKEPRPAYGKIIVDQKDWDKLQALVAELTELLAKNGPKKE
jgi:hypothetical protein